jgi:hypothetical protein
MHAAIGKGVRRTVHVGVTVVNVVFPTSAVFMTDFVHDLEVIAWIQLGCDAREFKRGRANAARLPLI